MKRKKEGWNWTMLNKKIVPKIIHQLEHNIREILCF